MSIHYACVCVGDTFGPEYVERLYRGIARNFQEDWDFTVICDGETLHNLHGSAWFAFPVSDRKKTVLTRLPLPPSWWHKINLFRNDIWPAGETVVYFDLDTIIVGDLGKLVSREGFSMISWPPPRWYPYNSSCMVFPAGIKPAIWEVWSKASEEVLSKTFPKGDQQLIAESFEGEIDPIGNDEVASYKRDAWIFGSAGARPETRNASVVAFHGKPRPHEIPEGYWAYNEWRRL